MNSSKKRLLALCSAAVVGAASYGVITAESVHHSNTGLTVGAARTVQTTTHVTSANSTKKTPVKAPVKKVTVKQKYKDGTYTGVGQTRIGAVQVAVTLKKDKITKAQITGYSTHYSISYIDPILPQELVARQNINKIDVISGATLSTEDFYYAVVSALQQAQQAEAHGSKSNA